MGLREPITGDRRLPVDEYSTAADSIQEGEMRVVSALTHGGIALSKHQVLRLSEKAERRHKWMLYYLSHDRNAALTCRHFDISSSTFYRWLARYMERQDPRCLEDRGSRPKRVRQRTWGRAEIEAVRALREKYPRWGKKKVSILLGKQGMVLSASTVGRILGYLKKRRLLREPARKVRMRSRRQRRPYATRMPRGYEVREPGDLVQIDTVHVTLLPGKTYKQFTLRDTVSRWDAVEVYSQATSKSAAKALESMLARLPFPVRAIQVDGGSEFMAEFEQLCQARGIRLFELPPRSPKLNGMVERANRTHKEEFYQCTEVASDLSSLRPALREWEQVYNTVRPHQALGYLTPLEFLTQCHN